MDIKDLEQAIGLPVADGTVIFTFPGIGSGKIHSELSGCTLQNMDMEQIAKAYSELGFHFIGLSTRILPETSRYIKYIQIDENLDIFRYTTIGDESYMLRVTFFVTDGVIDEISVDAAANHGKLVKKWIEERLQSSTINES
jgi:PHP family Zn ribbon phosphoesterase